MAPAFSTWAGQKTGMAARTFNYKRSAQASRSMSFNNKRAVVAVAKTAARKVISGKEKKYLTSGALALNLDTTGGVTDLTIIPTGNTVNTRVGKQVGLVAFQMKGCVRAATLTSTHGALLLVYDREPNAQAAVPGLTDILTSATSNALTNRDNAPRFKIVRRWDYNVVGNGGGASSPDSSLHIVDEYVKFNPDNYPIKWTAANTDGAYASKIKGALLLLYVGDVANGTTTPVANLQVRVDYQDL